MKHEAVAERTTCDPRHKGCLSVAETYKIEIYSHTDENEPPLVSIDADLCNKSMAELVVKIKEHVKPAEPITRTPKPKSDAEAK